MGCIVDGDDGGVRKTAFQGDGGELFGNFVSAADNNNAMFTLHLVGYYGWSNENADTRLAECLHQGAVVELSHDVRTELVDVEPSHQWYPYGGVFTGNEQGGRIENMGPLFFERFCKAWCGKKCNAAVSQLMAVAFHICFIRHGSVGQDQIDSLDRQFYQQPHQFVLATDNAYRRSKLHGRR